jgi:hypothetical protein
LLLSFVSSSFQSPSHPLPSSFASPYLSYMFTFPHLLNFFPNFPLFSHSVLE